MPGIESDRGGTVAADMPDRTPLDRVRELCLALPEVTERLSHGSPAWFIRDKKTFVMYLDDHHGDGRLALWCAAPEGMRRLKAMFRELTGTAGHVARENELLVEWQRTGGGLPQGGLRG